MSTAWHTASPSIYLHVNAHALMLTDIHIPLNCNICDNTLPYEMKAEGKLDDQAYMKRWLNDPDNRAFRTRPGEV